MCVSITTEKAAANWIAECVRVRSHWTRAYLDWAQAKGWLLNYDRKTCKPKVVPKPITGEPGMKVVEKAIDETTKLPVPAKRRMERVA